MDWFIIILLLSLSGTAAALVKMRRMKREIDSFTEQTEQALDHIISGKGFTETGEIVKDSLWGRLSERLWRVNHIWTMKEQAALEDKKHMKELISDISHQTKTPVANMKLYLEFLEEENLSQKGREFLSGLNRQTEKLDFLLKSMVKMSRLETGIIQVKKEPENLYKTVARAISQIVPAAAKKDISLSVDSEETLMVKHDKKWTEEAVFNVLDNAVKYTEARGSITVTVSRQEIFTKISVKDTGKGILLERQAEIFTRFYREPEVHGDSGIGIGLYLTRKILELQNGYIEVRSEPGKGSCFCLYLPNE